MTLLRSLKVEKSISKYFPPLFWSEKVVARLFQKSFFEPPKMGTQEVSSPIIHDYSRIIAPIIRV